MLLPLKVDISRISYPGALEVLAPLMPGSLLVAGIAQLVRPDWTTAFFMVTELGYMTKMLLLLLAAYVAGFILHYGVSRTIYILSFLSGVTLSNRGWLDTVFGSKAEPWQDRAWRKAAREFIGDDLAPDIMEPPVTTEVRENVLEQIRTETDPVKRMELWNVRRNQLDLDLASFEWYRWYSVLQEYFRDVKPANVESQLETHVGSTLHSLGWAGVIVLSFACDAHFVLWFFAVFSIVIGVSSDVLAAIFVLTRDNDSWGSRLTASMLRELRANRLLRNANANSD